MKRLMTFLTLGLLLIAGQVSADITTGLVSYWPLTSGYKATPTTVLDIVSNNNGTVVNAVVGAESTAFDGTGDWITFTNSGLNAVGATSITVAAWVYTDPADWDGTYDAYIDNADANINANDGFGLWISDLGGTYPVEGTLSWIRTGTGLHIEIKSNDNTISSVGWYHIVVTYTAGTGVVYINGADETASAGIGSGNFVPNTDAMYFGARNSGANPFTGNLSDGRIYSRALSPGDVAELYALGRNAMSNATIQGVTLTGVSVNAPAPVNFWDLAKDLIDRTGNIDGTETHAGTNRTFNDPDNNGQVTAIGAHLARFESVGGYRALLIEPEAENLVTYSHEFDEGIGDWVQTGYESTITSDAVVGPDGTVAADKLVQDATAGSSHAMILTLVGGDFTDSASVTFSIYAKPAENTWIRISLRTKNNNTVTAYFNLATGVVGTETVDSYGSETNAAWNGFYRYWITHDIEASGTQPRLYVYIAEADGDVIIDGDSTSGIYVWGAQVEESPVPTSYVATSGSTVTRATESGEPHFTLPTGLFDEKGTAIVWWRPGWDMADTSGSSPILTLLNSAAASFLYIHSALHIPTSYDGSIPVDRALTFYANTWYKLAVKWGYLVGGVKKYRIGVDSGSGVSWGLEGTFDGSYLLGTYLRLGFGLFSRMHLRGLRLFKDVLTDAQINRE